MACTDFFPCQDDHYFLPRGPNFCPGVPPKGQRLRLATGAPAKAPSGLAVPGSVSAPSGPAASGNTTALSAPAVPSDAAAPSGPAVS
eukprot:4955741-Pyramimonas_sp.AAC.1